MIVAIASSRLLSKTLRRDTSHMYAYYSNSNISYNTTSVYHTIIIVNIKSNITMSLNNRIMLQSVHN